MTWINSRKSFVNFYYSPFLLLIIEEQKKCVTSGRGGGCLVCIPVNSALCCKQINTISYDVEFVARYFPAQEILS